MIEISLTSFVDFVLKSGTPKMTVVKKTKKQIKAGYQPFTDYYKQIREGIIKFHKEDKQIEFLDSLTNNITDKSKSVNFPIIVANYKKFANKHKAAKWFSPDKSYWIIDELSVSLNPELGLEIKGQKHILNFNLKCNTHNSLSNNVLPPRKFVRAPRQPNCPDPPAETAPIWLSAQTIFLSIFTQFQSF